MTRLRRLFRRSNLDRELAGEIAAHIEEKADELMESGMSREDALLAARSGFGNRTSVFEQSREVWTFQAIESVFRDIRIGAGRFAARRCSPRARLLRWRSGSAPVWPSSA